MQPVKKRLIIFHAERHSSGVPFRHHHFILLAGRTGGKDGKTPNGTDRTYNRKRKVFRRPTFIGTTNAGAVGIAVFNPSFPFVGGYPPVFVPVLVGVVVGVVGDEERRRRARGGIAWRLEGVAAGKVECEGLFVRSTTEVEGAATGYLR